MSKPTSRSASVSRRTSSRSGGSVATAVTAKRPSRKSASKITDFRGALPKLPKVSPAQFRKTLVRLGINKPDGTLTGKYSAKG